MNKIYFEITKWPVGESLDVVFENDSSITIAGVHGGRVGDVVKRLKANPVYLKRAIAKISKELEYQEPLIKDNKIRKIVRDWNKLYDNKGIRIYNRGEYISLYKDGVKGYSLSVGIDLPKDALGPVIDDHYYNIVELCGEK